MFPCSAAVPIWSRALFSGALGPCERCLCASTRDGFIDGRVLFRISNTTAPELTRHHHRRRGQWAARRGATYARAVK